MNLLISIVLFCLFSNSLQSQVVNFLNVDQNVNEPFNEISLLDFFNFAISKYHIEKRIYSKRNGSSSSHTFKYLYNFKSKPPEKFINVKLRSRSQCHKDNMALNWNDMEVRLTKKIGVVPLNSNVSGGLGVSCNLNGSPLIDKIFYIDLTNNKNEIIKANIVIFNKAIIETNISGFNGFFIHNPRGGQEICQAENKSITAQRFIAISSKTAPLEYYPSISSSGDVFYFSFIIYGEKDNTYKNEKWVDCSKLKN